MPLLRNLFTAHLAALLIGCATGPSPEPLRIWFDMPTSSAGSAVWKGGADPEWESKSLPLGNGSLGANLMGSISRERLTLNEKYLWTGGPAISRDPSYYWNSNRNSAAALPEIRQAFLDGDDARAEELTRKNFGAVPERMSGGKKQDRFGFMTTLGELLIDTGLREGPVPEGFGKAEEQKVNYSGVNKEIAVPRPDPRSGPGETVECYERSLSLDSALVRVAFRQDGVSYKREAFVSYPDQVMAVRFSAGKGMDLALSYLDNPLAEGKTVSCADDEIVYSGRLKNNGERFALRVKAVCKRGAVFSEAGVLRVSGAREVVFLVASATNYRMNPDPDLSDAGAYYMGDDPEGVTSARVAGAARLGWKRLLRRHLADYQKLFCRVELRLSSGGAAPEEVSLRSTPPSLAAGPLPLTLPRVACPLGAVPPEERPTPYRLDRYRNGGEDAALEALYF
ncbi:MAG: glycoside hydrolase family 95 protein, partial [Bacteroidales bacterium]|nr:glycoside hydrolase family 95 protein [Bacteroidales bacterium]